MGADSDADETADSSDETAPAEGGAADEQDRDEPVEADEGERRDTAPEEDGRNDEGERRDTAAEDDEGSEEDVDAGESTDPDASVDEAESVPAVFALADVESGWEKTIVPLEDVRGNSATGTTDTESSATRELQRDLTPDEVDVDHPDEFEFEYVPTERLPTGVQYTPDFDPDWVYPSGSADGGRQDDTPVQGIEVGVIGTEDEIEATVRSVLDAVSLYYEDTGQYPRHRLIKSASAFEAVATDGVGLVAVLQPSPDEHDGLRDHMQAVQSNDRGAVNSNVQATRRLVQYLGAQLVADELEGLGQDLDVVAATGWETGAQIGTLPIAERYAPLGANEVYDPAIEDLDLSEDGVPSIADAGFTPQRLSIETNAELFAEPAETD